MIALVIFAISKFFGIDLGWGPTFLAAATIGGLYFARSRRAALSQWKQLNIPGPEPNFWFGNAKEMPYGRADIMKVLQDWSKKYGKVFGYYVGLRPQLQITDVDIVKEIFVKQFSNFVNRPDTQQMEQNLARLRDNEWKENRRIMNPIFTTKKLKNLTNMVNEAEEHLLEIIDEKIRNNEDIPAYKTAQGLTFQIISKTAFAMDVDCQRNDDDPFYVSVKKWLAVPYNILSFLILMFPGLQKFFRFFIRFESKMEIWKDMHSHVRGIIKNRRENPQNKQDLLGLMLEAASGAHAVDHKKELTADILKEDDDTETSKVEPKASNVANLKSGKFLMSDTQMVDNLILFLAAGFDSTSNTIAFAMHFLAINQEIQERAFSEIINEIGYEETISAEDCKKLQFVEQIIFETLRLFPPVPVFLHRECKKTVTIKGFTIPEGTVVETPPWVLHRDADYWPEPEKFDPDRFAPENLTEVQKIAFAPWGMGPRMCIGARFALIEATTALAKIIRAYRIVPSENFKHDLKVCVKNILLNPAEEIYVTMVRRD